MKELVKKNHDSKTLPEDIPSCERLKSEVILDQTEVYLPPPGVALFPVVPVPVPVPPGKKECCAPGQMYDPRTGKCRCPCPEGELPPVAVLDNNGSAVDGLARPCGSCRNGATFNPETCSCECPCPQGFLLPGQGCVPQCPEGYSETYDASSSPPYRCRYCVQTGVGNEPLPPPLKQCQTGDQCDHCDDCVLGTCVPRVCKTGFYLDHVSCQCLSVKNGEPIACSDNAQCPSCQACVRGKCIPRIISCPDQQRLNLETCQCEPENGSSQPPQEAPRSRPRLANSTVTAVPEKSACGADACRMCRKAGANMNAPAEAFVVMADAFPMYPQSPQFQRGDHLQNPCLRSERIPDHVPLSILSVEEA